MSPVIVETMQQIREIEKEIEAHKRILTSEYSTLEMAKIERETRKKFLDLQKELLEAIKVALEKRRAKDLGERMAQDNMALTFAPSLQARTDYYGQTLPNTPSYPTSMEILKILMESMMPGGSNIAKPRQN